jgi:hypothetical protein
MASSSPATTRLSPCTASRASLVTGYYLSLHGDSQTCGIVKGIPFEAPFVISAEENRLPECLCRSGTARYWLVDAKTALSGAGFASRVFTLVPTGGFEPPRPLGQQILSLQRLTFCYMGSELAIGISGASPPPRKTTPVTVNIKPMSAFLHVNKTRMCCGGRHRTPVPPNAAARRPLRRPRSPDRPPFQFSHATPWTC